MKSSTIDLAFIKFVQDGSQNNSQCCINQRAWTSANKIWIIMIKKVMPSWTESSLVTKHGSTITSRSVNSRLWNGNIHNHPSGNYKSQPLAGKLMLTVFWDSQGPILEHYQERGSTINSACNNEMLIDRLKPEFRSKHRGQLSEGIVLLHDNACPHTAAHTVETIQKLKFEVLAHPPCSPDLAPSDYHLFSPLTEALRGLQFTSDQELKEVVHAWLTSQPKTFFSEGIKKFVQRWK